MGRSQDMGKSQDVSRSQDVGMATGCQRNVSEERVRGTCQRNVSCRAEDDRH